MELSYTKHSEVGSKLTFGTAFYYFMSRQDYNLRFSN